MSRIHVVSEADPGFELEPRTVLQIMGPRIDVEVSLHPIELQQRRLEQVAVAEPIAVRALVDTGANMTLVDESIRATFDPSVIDHVALKGIHSDTKPRLRPVFRMLIAFPGSDMPAWFAVVASEEIREKAPDVQVILGRDFLFGKRFTYNGIKGLIAITDE